MSELRTGIESAKLRWLANGVPYSQDFDDIYFSPSDGVAESEYVYLAANQLPERWQVERSDCTPLNFTIGELGFGSGLNFLLATRAWRAHSCPGRLDYFGLEKHPLSKQDLRKALSLFPQFQQDTEALLAQYPPLLSGFHRLELSGGVTLNLLFGEASDSLAALRHSDRPELCEHSQAIDAWYLDGFAPSKNAAMWSAELLHLVGSLSKPGTTFSTFTAAGHVRRALQENGFSVEKRSGFGTKREMLVGSFEGAKHIPTYRRNRWFPATTWYSIPNQRRFSAQSPASKRVAIIGGGLAGCTTAAALAQRGISCVVFDSRQSLACGASGNPGAALYNPLSAHSSPLADFSLQAYLYACHYYSRLLDDSACGLLQCVDDVAKAAELADCINDTDYLQLMDPSVSAKKAKLTLGAHGAALFFPHGRAVNMRKLCEQLSRSEHIEVLLGKTVSSISAAGNAWRLQGDQLDQDDREFDCVIVCCGAYSRQFTQLTHLPTRVIRGQVSRLQSTGKSAELDTIVCADSYLLPAEDGQHWAGSSYVLDDWSEQIRAEEHLSNAAAAAQLIEDKTLSAGAAIDGWAALRCTSPDYLPIVGQAPIVSEFLRVFADLQHDKNKPLQTSAPYHSGLFVNAAYGSRGLSFAPLCAAQLASEICGELSPLPSPLRHALSPSRFIVRNITRGHFAAR